MSFSAHSFGDKLKTVDSSQGSITKLSHYIQYQQGHIEQIADIWLQVFIRSSPDHQLCLIYL